jgi:hypothetical protein
VEPLNEDELASIRQRAGTHGAFGGVGAEEAQRLLATVDFWKAEADAERKLRHDWEVHATGRLSTGEKR